MVSIDFRIVIDYVSVEPESERSIRRSSGPRYAMRIPRIKDVAQHAGVSVATVSRALAGRPGVSDEVRRRVQESARALNYRPDQIARSLRRRQSNLIGLVISTI